MIDTDGKLGGVGCDLGGGCIGVCLVRTGGVVGQRIAGQDRGDAGIDGDG